MAKERNNTKAVQSKADQKRADKRSRVWAIVVYPTEGNPPAPANWVEILDGMHIKWVEGPLHDADKNADGTPKRAHKHITLIFTSLKSYDQVKEITEQLNAPIPQKCSDIKAMVRYMAHLDNPDKAQYPVSEIIGHGGADVASYLQTSMSERYECIGEMIEYIHENNITEFMGFLLYAKRERYDDWFKILCDNATYIIKTAIASQRFGYSDDVDMGTEAVKWVNTETGEIIE